MIISKRTRIYTAVAYVADSFVSSLIETSQPSFWLDWPCIFYNTFANFNLLPKMSSADNVCKTFCPRRRCQRRSFCTFVHGS